jgi:hypothetical protein
MPQVSSLMFWGGAEAVQPNLLLCSAIQAAPVVCFERMSGAYVRRRMRMPLHSFQFEVSTTMRGQLATVSPARLMNGRNLWKSLWSATRVVSPALICPQLPHLLIRPRLVLPCIHPCFQLPAPFPLSRHLHFHRLRLNLYQVCLWNQL